jgi:tetratricopeptide (TPR) repeat protein
MKKIFGTAIAMALSVILACGALGIGFYHLEISKAQEALATFDAARADRIYARLEKTLETGRHLPWIFKTVHEDLQVRRSRLSYWRQDYAAILEETAATGENEKTLSPSLRFIRANARYRAITGEQSREQVIRDLGQSIRDYAKIIETDPTFIDAAFNYEFLLMLRDDIAGGRRSTPFRHPGAPQSQPDKMKGVHGEQGAEPGAKVPQQMKVLVPKEGGEDPTKRGPEPGKGSATKKRG